MEVKFWILCNLFCSCSLHIWSREMVKNGKNMIPLCFSLLPPLVVWDCVLRKCTLFAPHFSAIPFLHICIQYLWIFAATTCLKLLVLGQYSAWCSVIVLPNTNAQTCWQTQTKVVTWRQCCHRHQQREGVRNRRFAQG